MNLQSEWLADGGNVPQGLNACDTWMARVKGGSPGSYPIMPPGYELLTATDLGGGEMVLTGIFTAVPSVVNAFVDAFGGPYWSITAIQPSANPSLTWQSGQQQCLPTVGFNPSAGAGNPAKPAQPGTPAPLPPPVQITPPVKAPAPVGASSSSSGSASSTALWVGGAVAALAIGWALLK